MQSRQRTAAERHPELLDTAGDRLLTRKEVEVEIGLSRTSIYRLMDLPSEDPLHLPRPKPRGRRAVGWPRSWIEAWKDRQQPRSRPHTG